MALGPRARLALIQSVPGDLTPEPLPGVRRDPGGDLPRFLSIPPWDVSPPPTATPFYLSQLPNLVVPNVVGATVESTIPGGGAIQLPPKNVAVIAGVILFCNAPDLTTQIRYTIRQNGSPVPGLAAIGFPPQVNAFLNWGVDGPYTALNPGAFLNFTIQTIAVGTAAWTVNVALSGWFCAIDDILRWTGKRPGNL